MQRTEYEAVAAVETTHWWHGGMRAIVAAWLNARYHGRTDLRILDSGCGTGGTLLFLERYGHAIGIDSSPDAIALCHSAVADRMVRGSVLALPFADDSFDLVTSFDVLYHRDVTDEGQALREIARVLRSNGRLLLRLPAYEFLRSKHDRAVHTARRYTARQVRTLLQTHGFWIERCSYVNTLLFPIAVAQRLLERAIPRFERTDSDLTLPPAPLNALLRIPLAVEAAWLDVGGTFPFGLSIMCLAHCGKIDRIVPADMMREHSDELPA